MRLLPFHPICTAPELRQPTLQDYQVGRLGNISDILTSGFASLGTELGQKSRVQADLKAEPILLNWYSKQFSTKKATINFHEHTNHSKALRS